MNKITAAAILPLVLSSVPGLKAQQITISCISNLSPDCKANVGPPEGFQHAVIEVRVTRGDSAVRGSRVAFVSTSGNLQPDTAVTDTNGIARSVWFRSKGADVVGIAIQARAAKFDAADISVPVLITLKPTEPSPRPIMLLDAGGLTQSWFQKSQTPRPIRVALKARPGDISLDPASCAANKVVFKLRGAQQSVSPDTASGVMDSRGNCYVETFWSMGEGIGERRVDIALVSGKGFTANTLEAEGWTRATPRFIGGFAGGWLRGYRTINPAAQRLVHIERIDAAGVKHAYDTTETTGQPTLKDVHGSRVYSAVAAVSLPIPIARLGRNDNLALTAGVDISKPLDRQYYGFSVLQLAGRWIPVIEALPMDLHALRFYARQPELIDPRCAITDCKTRERIRSQGWAFMISADATQLIGDVVKRLNP